MRHISSAGGHSSLALMFEVLEDRVLLSSGMEFRTITGVDNNVTPGQEDYGAAATQLLRLTTVDYADGVSAPSGSTRPSARVISNQVNSQFLSAPSERLLTSFVFQWGQFLDHDIDLTDGAHPPEAFNISVPQGDRWFDPFRTGAQVIPLSRSVYDPSTSLPGVPRQQLNQITAFIDGSNVYGSDDARAAALRTGIGGKLKTSAGDLLPFNFVDPATGQFLPNAGFGDPASFFVAGDVRANEQTALTAMHTLFVREHNRLADEIATNEFAGADLTDPAIDEAIYQRARRIVGALLQVITYNEFLPAVLGPNSPIGPYQGYDDTVNPGIANVFSTAAFRVGHSMLPSELLRLDESGNPIPQENLALRDAFFNPSRITDEGGIDPILRGLAAKIEEEIDAKIIDDVRNFLFGPPGAGGFDLASLNIQRGRDHGLPSYNQVRIDMGLAPATSFTDISSDPAVWVPLMRTYGNVDNVDAWVGGIAEDHLPGSSLGELFTTIWVDQFERLRDGDRFFYLNNQFTVDELKVLENTRLSDIIRRNTSISNIQDEVFWDASVFVYRAPAGQEPVEVRVEIAGSDVRVVDSVENKVLASQPVSRTSAIVLFGTNDSDHFVLNLTDPSLNMPAEIRGGWGDDVLEVRGTNGNDRIEVSEAVVAVNRVDVSFGHFEKVAVAGGIGNDYVRVRGALTAALLIDGGAGYDRLEGGSGHEILIGGDDHDILRGGGGRDMLIGGTGCDRLEGGSGDDLLISGVTAYDDDYFAWWSMQAAFMAGGDMSSLFNTSTVWDDSIADLLFGGDGDDQCPVVLPRDFIFS